jgi:predicted metal-binding protein
MMRFLCLAICSLGVWVALTPLVEADWVSYVFGGIAAVLAFLAAFLKK